MKILALVAVATGCVSPAHCPTPPVAPTPQHGSNTLALDPLGPPVVQLSYESRVPLINREARLVAGYYEPSGDKEGAFIVKMEGDSLFDGPGRMLDPKRDTTGRFVDRVQPVVDTWLARGTWRRMLVATKLPPVEERDGVPTTRYSFATLGIYARVLDRAPSFVAFFRSSDDAYMGESPLYLVGARLMRVASGEIQRDVPVQVDTLAYDPVTQIVWVSYRMKQEDLKSWPETVYVFHLFDRLEFPDLMRMPVEGP